MTADVLFIENHKYDFVEKETGERCRGISCSVFDPTSKKILKVSGVPDLLPLKFGDKLTVGVELGTKKLTFVEG